LSGPDGANAPARTTRKINPAAGFSNEFQRRNAAFLTLLAPNFPAKLLVAEQMTR
jgi:hypothetical protein